MTMHIDADRAQPNLFDDLQSAQEIVQRPAAKVRHNARPTSRAAAFAALPRSGGTRWRVLDEIVAMTFSTFYAGATDEELQARLKLSPNTERPRRIELVDGGWVEASERCRATMSGNASIVWRATTKALAEFAEQ